MLYDNVQDMVSVAVTATLAYLWLVLLLRISGKRTLAQLNAFDFIVTVALGSIMASVALSESVAWTEGAVALATFAALQFVIAWASTRVGWVRTALTSKPTLLLSDGELLWEALMQERIDEDSVSAAIRSNGSGTLESIGAVVLETDGSLSVIPKTSVGDGSALQGLGR